MDALVLSDIEPTRRGRFALFANGEFLFSVDGETLRKHRLEVGGTLSAAQLDALREASDTRAAKDKALVYLSLRSYGSAELYEKLCRSFDERTAAAAVAEMVRLELLDDPPLPAAAPAGCPARAKAGATSVSGCWRWGLTATWSKRCWPSCPTMSRTSSAG